MNTFNKFGIYNFSFLAGVRPSKLKGAFLQHRINTEPIILVQNRGQHSFSII